MITPTQNNCFKYDFIVLKRFSKLLLTLCSKLNYNALKRKKNDLKRSCLKSFRFQIQR